MKRIFAILLICLLLCGCGGQPQETVSPTETAPAVSPTEPAGSYQPGSEIEQATGGAVRAYPQNLGEIWDIEAVGEDLLVFSGSDTTTITRLSGENLFRVAEVQLNTWFSTEHPSLYLSDEWVIYYDSVAGEMVYLDETLRESIRLEMPDDLMGYPVMSSDRNLLYYCTAEGLRVMDLETGISRLLKEMTFAHQSMDGVLMNDTVLRVEVTDADGNGETLFLDAQTGSMAGALSDNMSLTSGTDNYYLLDTEGVVQQMIFGRAGEQSRQLTPRNYLDTGEFLTFSHGAVVFSADEEAAYLDYYDLESGMRTSSLALLHGMQPGSYARNADSGRIYFLDHNQENGCRTIYRWNLDATLTSDKTVYTGPRYTLGEPDTEGLAECRILADRLSQQHGLEILFGEEATNVQPWDYNLVAEYQVPVIMEALHKLEQVLSNYPEGFFVTAMEGLEDGKLTVSLVRSLVGSHESGSLETAEGIHFWDGNDSYVALTMGQRMESTFYHEMFHALETRVLSESIAYYRWDELNPKGFEYDENYITNLERDGEQYLNDDTTRAFIDTYSMSYAKEDRARVMEFACTEGNENYFISYTMQKKLKTLCEGIREAYGLEESTEEFLWEQYLETPIAYQEK